MRPRIRDLLPAVLALGVLTAGAAGAADISAAERLVFMDDHFDGLHAPAALRYSFNETGSGPSVAHEQLRLNLSAQSDGGCCSVAAEEEGGATFGVLPPVDGAKANPVILYFLERDVRQMQTLTGGQSSYFRRLIRLALADHATVKDTMVLYDGHELPAHEVRVVPYADDPRVAQFGPLAGKTYTFLLAKAVPGGVFQIKAAVSAPAAGAPAAIETVLTLADSAAAAPDGGSVQRR